MENLEYDIPDLKADIVKKNIKRIMDEKGIKQVELVKVLAPMQQPDVSKCLNPNEKRNFTIEQLYKIAYFLNTSLDDLTGLAPAKMHKDKEISLSDACESFLRFYDIIHPRIHEIVIPEENEEKKETEKKRFCIYSDCKNINEMLSYFSKVISLDDKKVLDLCKKSFIEENQYRLRKYNFRTENECTEEYLEYWIGETYRQCEIYRKTIGDDIYYENKNYNNLKKVCEELYYFLKNEHKVSTLMYDAVDNFIEKKQYSKSCSEYISLMLFKQIHTEESNPS